MNLHQSPLYTILVDESGMSLPLLPPAGSALVILQTRLVFTGGTVYYIEHTVRREE